jgi:hypothetical protein
VRKKPTYTKEGVYIQRAVMNHIGIAPVENEEGAIRTPLPPYFYLFDLFSSHMWLLTMGVLSMYRSHRVNSERACQTRKDDAELLVLSTWVASWYFIDVKSLPVRCLFRFRPTDRASRASRRFATIKPHPPSPTTLTAFYPLLHFVTALCTPRGPAGPPS